MPLFVCTDRPAVVTHHAHEMDHPSFTTPIKPRAPSFSMGTRSPSAANISSPGPGGYTPEKALTRAPAYSMGHRTPDPIERMSAGNPGPGAYTADAQQQKFNRSPAFTMPGRTPDPLRARVSTPGAGAYSPEKPTQRAAAFSFAQRYPSKDDPNAPSPVTYSPSHAFSKTKSPTHVIAARAPQPTGLISPGPGAYGQDPAKMKATTQAPSYTFASRTPNFASPEAGRDTPGPGAYGASNSPLSPKMARAKQSPTARH